MRNRKPTVSSFVECDSTDARMEWCLFNKTHEKYIYSNHKFNELKMDSKNKIGNRKNELKHLKLWNEFELNKKKSQFDWFKPLNPQYKQMQRCLNVLGQAQHSQPRRITFRHM